MSITMSITFGFKRPWPIASNELKVQCYSPPFPSASIREWVKELWALLPANLERYLSAEYDSDDAVLTPPAGPYYVIGAKTSLTKAQAEPLVKEWAEAVEDKYGHNSLGMYKDTNFCCVYEFFPPLSYVRR